MLASHSKIKAAITFNWPKAYGCGLKQKSHYDAFTLTHLNSINPHRNCTQWDHTLASKRLIFSSATEIS